MATRIYLPSSGSAPVTPSDWEFAYLAGTTYTLPGSLSKTNTALTSRTTATGTTSPRTTGVMRYIIGKLKAQTIAGTVNMVMLCSESNALANATLAISVKIIQPNGADRAILLAPAASDNPASPYEIATTLNSRRVFDVNEARPINLTSQSAQDGDYLVIEIGFRSATTTSRNIVQRHGDPSATADCADGEGSTNDYCPWVEFSQTLTWTYSPAGLTGGITPSGTLNEVIYKSLSGAISPSGDVAGIIPGSGYTEDFAGAAGDLPDPPWTKHADFDHLQRDGSGRCRVTSGTESAAGYSGGTFNADQYSQFKIVGSYLEVSVCVRMTFGVDGTWYDAGMSGTTLTFGRYTGAGWSSMNAQSGLTALSQNDVIRLEVSGWTLKFFVNGVQRGTDYVDTNHYVASGVPGIDMWTDSSLVDDWAGGSLVAGSQFTKNDLAGGISPSGLLDRLPKKVLSGIISPSGLLAKLTTKPLLSGGLTPTGGLAKQTRKPLLAGGISPSGLLTGLKVALKSLAGAITPTGDITKQTRKPLSGGITPAGGLVKKTIVATTKLIGAISPSGALAAAKVFLKALAGAISPSGAVKGFVSKVLSGGITPIGGLIKQARRTLAGAITPAGLLSSTKVILKALSGAITPTGGLIRRAGKALVGVIAPTGGLVKQIGKRLEGAISPAAVLVSEWISGVQVVATKWLTLARRQFDFDLSPRPYNLRLPSVKIGRFQLRLGERTVILRLPKRRREL